MRFDLHVHTHYSACSTMKPAELLKAAKRKQMDGIAVVDHGTMKGSIAAAKLNRDRNFRVMRGMEINSDVGHLLAMDINSEIKSRNLDGIVDEVNSQGGILVAAHPYSLSPLHHIKVPFERLKGIHALEAFNSRNGLFGNSKAMRIASENNFPVTGGSDAHFAFEVGNAFTEFDGSLKSALRRKNTHANGKIGFGPLASLLSGIKKVIG